MEMEQAIALLDEAVRSELRDHAFGDAEVFWTKDGKDVAGGYFSGSHASVSVRIDGGSITFGGDEARELRKHGVLGDIDRNDETGPAQYHEGAVMPGLTKEGVYKELTGSELSDLEDDSPPVVSS